MNSCPALGRPGRMRSEGGRGLSVGDGAVSAGVCKASSGPCSVCMCVSGYLHRQFLTVYGRDSKYM